MFNTIKGLRAVSVTSPVVKKDKFMAASAARLAREEAPKGASKTGRTPGRPGVALKAVSGQAGHRLQITLELEGLWLK